MEVLFRKTCHPGKKTEATAVPKAALVEQTAVFPSSPATGKPSFPTNGKSTYK
jgi:hypothetical protein